MDFLKILTQVREDETVSPKLAYQHYRYCSKCAKYIATDGYRCPYCGTLLRLKPRRSRSKNKLERNINDNKMIDPAKYGVDVEE